MIMGERAHRRTDRARGIAHWAANHTGVVETVMNFGVATQALSRAVIGNGATDAIAQTMRSVSGDRIPRVSSALRRGPGAPKRQAVNLRQSPKDDGIPVSIAQQFAPLAKIVYFPACPSRMFGAPKTDLDLLSTSDAIIALLERVGYEVIVPDHLDGQCCGQPWQSKGFPDEAARVGQRLDGELAALSEHGKLPVITDASTCAKHMQGHAGVTPAADSAEFLVEHVLPRLNITRPIAAVAVHHNSSAQRLKEQGATETIAAACATKVSVLSSINCCGYAGDKGLFVPELNAWATRFAKSDIPAECTIGVSTVSTCASGLSERAGIPFVSLASLLEAVSRPVAS